MARIMVGNVRDAERAALIAFAHRVLRTARELAPKTPPPGVDPDPGVTLADSGKVVPMPDGSVWVVFDAPYAAKQHEARHFQHPQGGQAKFLEEALKRHRHELEGIVASAVGARLKAGTTSGGRFV